MKIFRALISGGRKTLNVWIGVLIVWIWNLLLVYLIAVPLKRALITGFGQSMITERLMDGIDVEVFADLGKAFGSIAAYLSSGILLLLFLGMLMNVFLTGGLFHSLRSTSSKFSVSDFFKACAANFWSFLLITLIINIILLFSILFVTGLPFGLAAQSFIESGKTPFLVIAVTLSIAFFFVLVLILVADYSRAWQVVNIKPAFFKALGFGFVRTFNTFLSSFPVMFIIFLVQVLFLWLVLKIVGPWKPVTGGGVILLFVSSQILFFIRILLKTWRYASVTSLKEINDISIIRRNHVDLLI